ncbi:MAG: GIY-YIG nuclease family protein [Ignavibacteria bacterium]
MKSYYVYILTNKKNGVLYTGFTDDIKRRLQDIKVENTKDLVISITQISWYILKLH